MTILSDPIADVAYTELLIACQVDGCPNVFQKSLEEPATDPVELWATAMAKLAREAGWSTDATGRVLCPTHRHLDAPKSEDSFTA